MTQGSSIDWGAAAVLGLEEGVLDSWGCSVLATSGGEGRSVKRRGWVEGGRRPGESQGGRERQGREGSVDMRVSEGGKDREDRKGRAGVFLSGRIGTEGREGRVGISGSIDGQGKEGSNWWEVSEERE